MTYAEKITYLTGNFIELAQFSLKNACRLVSLINRKEETKLDAGACFSLAEAEAKKKVEEYTFQGSKKILEDLKDKGLPIKIFDKLSFVLKKRDYVVSRFYLDNASQIATEQVVVYVSKINELQEYCDAALKLNQVLAKECDKQY